MRNTNMFLKSLTVVFFCSLVVIIIVLTFSVEPKFFNVEKGGENLPDLYFEGVKITHVDNGVKVIDVFADKVSIYDDKNSLIMHDVLGEVYEEDQLSLLFESEKGIFEIGKNKLTLADAQSIFLSGKSVFALQMDSFLWNIDEFVGSGQGNVQIKDKHFNITADSMNIDLNQELIQIDKSVILKVKGLN